MPEVPLYPLDLALLAMVQRSNLSPARVLADRIGLSERSVLRRLRRLRRDGVIVADVSVVRPSAIGLGLTVIVLVSLEREGVGVVDAFAKRIKRRPEVRQCWYITGDADWAMVLRLASMDAYEAFMRDMFLADANVRGFRTLVALREVVGEADARPVEPPMPLTYRARRSG